MLNFSPCMDIFFKDLPFEKRIEKIAGLGYKHFEFWSWWNKDVKVVKKAATDNGVKVCAFCTKFISLVNETKRSDYLAGLRETIDVSKMLGNKIIISQVGNELQNVSREEQRNSMIEGLKESAKLLAGTDLVIAVEPLNLLYDHAGYFLSRSDEAYAIVKAVNSPNVKILFDIYHQQITEGNIINNIKKYYDQIAHFHVADHPGRHEIVTGEINYANILKTISDLGFEGGIGIELFPINKNHTEVLSDELFFSI